MTTSEPAVTSERKCVGGLECKRVDVARVHSSS